jgi:hypothetical protein
MITVGLIKELLFVSKSLRTSVTFKLSSERIKSEILAVIKERNLEVWYLGYRIWNESLDEDISMFGVESCDTIARIVLLIDAGDDVQWRELVYNDKSP